MCGGKPKLKSFSLLHTTLWIIKRWQYICDYNSGKSWWIFIIFALLYAGRNALGLHKHDKNAHLT